MKPLPSRVAVAGMIVALAGSLAARGQEAPLLEIPPLEVIHYDWRVTPDFATGTLAADCGITVRNPSETPVDVVPLLLYRLLAVRSATDDRGREVPFSQQVVSFSDYRRMQVNAVTLHPLRPIGPGEELTIRLRYEGHLLGYTETGSTYIRDTIDPTFTILRLDGLAYPELGVPCWAANHRRGLGAYDYRIAVTVPDSLVAANGGALLAVDEAPGRRTYRFGNLRPAWRMDVAIAAYDVVRLAGGARIYVFPEDRAGGTRVARAMARADSLYAAWFGPRPVDHGVSVIEIPAGWGSQTDVTCIIQSAAAFRDPQRLYEFYHEMAHLWQPPALDPQPSRLESEGLAMFLQARAAELLDGQTGALAAEEDRLRERFLRACARRPAAAEVPIARFGQEQLTDLSYTKGMLFFGMLYRILGEQRFLQLIARHFRVHREGHTLAQFVDLCLAQAQDTERDGLQRLIEEWIDGAESSRLLLGDASLAQIAARYDGTP